MRALRLLFCFIVFAMALPSASICAVYCHIDENGVLTVTNVEPQKGKSTVIIRDGEAPRNVPALSDEENNAYDNLISRHARTHGVDPRLVKAIMIAESRGNPNAVSRKGARGLMQIMPCTARSLALKHPFDPSENIEAGAIYLKRLHKRFTGNTELILAAYNAGPRRVMESNMTVPRINETVRYIERVKQYYEELKAPVETRWREEDNKALFP
jgi:soluble lytic murein transglycosylase-like protein